MLRKHQVRNVKHQNLKVPLFGFRHLIGQKWIRRFHWKYLATLIFINNRTPEGAMGAGVPQHQEINKRCVLTGWSTKSGGILKLLIRSYAKLATTEILIASSSPSVFNVSSSYCIESWKAMRTPPASLFLYLRMNEYQGHMEGLRLCFLNLDSWKRAIWIYSRLGKLRFRGFPQIFDYSQIQVL